METPATALHPLIITTTIRLLSTMNSSPSSNAKANATAQTLLQPEQGVSTPEKLGQSSTLSVINSSAPAPGSSSERSTPGLGLASGPPYEGDASRLHPPSSLTISSLTLPMNTPPKLKFPVFDQKVIPSWIKNVEDALNRMSVSAVDFESPTPPNMVNNSEWDGFQYEVLAVASKDATHNLVLIPKVLHKIDNYVRTSASAWETLEAFKAALAQKQRRLEEQVTRGVEQIRNLSTEISNAELTHLEFSQNAETPSREQLVKMKAVVVDYQKEQERLKRRQEATERLHDLTAQLQNATSKCHIQKPRAVRSFLATHFLPASHPHYSPPPITSPPTSLLSSMFPHMYPAEAAAITSPGSLTFPTSHPPQTPTQALPSPAAPFRSQAPPYARALRQDAFPNATSPSSVRSGAPSTSSVSQRRLTVVKVPDNPNVWEWASNRLISDLKLRRIKIDYTPIPHHLRVYPYHQLDRDILKSGGSPPPRDLDNPDTVSAYETYMETVSVGRHAPAAPKFSRTPSELYEEFINLRVDSPLLENLQSTRANDDNLAVLNWQLTGWSAHFVDRRIIQLIATWPITLENDDVTISNVGQDKDGSTIRAANFMTAGIPVHLWKLAKARAFKVDECWFHLRISKYQREQLTDDSKLLVYRAQISRETRTFLKPLDIPHELESRLLRDLNIDCIISPPGANNSWGVSICISGQFNIVFRTEDDADKFQASKKNYLTILGVDGLGEIDAITGETETEDLGEFQVKWLWFQSRSTVRAVRAALRNTGTRFKGLRRSCPSGSGVLYIIGFDSPEDRLQFTMSMHRQKAPYTLYPFTSDVQRVEHYYNVPKGFCFKCFHPNHMDKARHYGRDCSQAGFCRVCKEHTHTEEDCGHVPEVATITHRNPANRRRLIPTVNRALSDAGSTRSDRSTLSLRTARFGAMAKRNRRNRQMANTDGTEAAATDNVATSEDEARPPKKSNTSSATG